MGLEGSRIAVVGAGLMGHSIAAVFARRGAAVTLVDRDQEALARGLAGIERIEALFERAGGGRAGRTFDVRATTDLREGVPEASLVVEAVTEDPGVKRALFEDLGRVCRPDAIVASNSSFLDVFGIGGLARPERLVAAHWLTPAHIVPLVEVAPGPLTSSGVLDATRALLERAGKRVVLMDRFAPGLVVNRLQRAVAAAALELVAGGFASPDQVDRAARLSLGIRLPVVGVLQTFDFAGLDLCLRVLERAGEPPALLAERVRAGHVGVRSSRGLYDYGGRSEAQILEERDELLLRILDALERMGLDGSSPWREPPA